MNRTRRPPTSRGGMHEPTPKEPAPMSRGTTPWLLSAAALFAVAAASVGLAEDRSVKAKSVLDFKVKDIDGKEVDLSQYKGDVLLIVNVASKCGYTPQYKGLEATY